MTGSSQNSSDAFREDIPANQIGTRGWYFTKEEIDNHSPSRKDGIDRATESSLRRSYCSFLQDLSKMLRVYVNLFLQLLRLYDVHLHIQGIFIPDM